MFRWEGRRGLAVAFVGCVAVTVPSVVAPTVVVRGGFDFNRVEDVAHGGATALVVVTLALLMRRPAETRSLAVAALATVAAASAAEVVQLAAPGRSSSAADLAWDLIGVAVGLAIVVWPRLSFEWLRRATTGVLAAIGLGALVLVAPV